MLNNVIILGRITANPEIRTTTNGHKVCDFSVAVQRPKGKDTEPKADFFHCVAWEGTAELIEKYFSKGNMIAIQGQLRNEAYLKNNEKRTITRIIVEKISFTGENKKKDQSDESFSNSIAEVEAPYISDEELDLIMTDDGVPF